MEEIYAVAFVSLVKGGLLYKKKNLLPLGANSFLIEKIPFQNGIEVQELKLSPL